MAAMFAVRSRPQPAVHARADRSTGVLRVAAVVLACWPLAAPAEIAWHADLDAAHAAATLSGKPVFALFNASWDDSQATEVLSTSEADAVVSACFEPVRIDVEANRELARELGVEHVPSVVVLAASGEVLTRFDCPSTGAAFVAAAARAAQITAAAPSAQGPAQELPGGREPLAGAFRADVEQPTTSVMAKVRRLASFAEGKPMSAAGLVPRQGPAAIPAEGPPSQAELPTALSEQPRLSQAPPAPLAGGWPAEKPVAATFEPFQIAPPAAAATGEPGSAGLTPWLAGAASATPAGGVESASSVTDLEEHPAGPSAEAKPHWFTEALQRPLSVFSRRPTQAAAEPPATMPPARPQRPAAVAANPAPASAPASSDFQGSMPLGLEGYCPVTVAERGVWVEGRAQWGVRHRGRTYLFAGPEQQQAFLYAPDRYAPALSGDDPVLAFDGGTSEPGRRAFGVTYQSRMYLFATPETRAQFAADPPRYTARVQIAEGLPAAEAPRRF